MPSLQTSAISFFYRCEDRFVGAAESTSFVVQVIKLGDEAKILHSDAFSF